MSDFVLVCVSLAGFVVACFALAMVGRALMPNNWGYPRGRFDWVGWMGLCFCAPLLICGIIALIIYPSRAVGRTTCHNWSVQTGYQTKFTILNWADTGTCLAKASDGRWVPNTQIIINVPAKP